MSVAAEESHMTIKCSENMLIPYFSSDSDAESTTDRVMGVRKSVFLGRFILSSSLIPLIINVTLTHCILNEKRVMSNRNIRKPV